VVHQHRTAGLGRPPHDSLAHLDPQVTHGIVRMPDAETHPQLLRLLMQQEDGKDLVVYGALHHLGNEHHQLVEIKRGIDALAHLEQQSEKLRQFQRSSSGFDSLRHLKIRDRFKPRYSHPRIRVMRDHRDKSEWLPAECVSSLRPMPPPGWKGWSWYPGVSRRPGASAERHPAYECRRRLSLPYPVPHSAASSGRQLPWLRKVQNLSRSSRIRLRRVSQLGRQSLFPAR